MFYGKAVVVNVCEFLM